MGAVILLFVVYILPLLNSGNRWIGFIILGIGALLALIGLVATLIGSDDWQDSTKQKGESDARR